MAGNTSSAVRQQRREAPDSLDYFPTPPFATRALCEFLEQQLGELGELEAWEPAAGGLHMARPLLEAFKSVRASDVFAYDDETSGCALELELIDFTLTGATEPDVDLIATNPPFVLACEFIETALQKARLGVAMLVRTSFIEGEERLDELFEKCPPTFALQFSERVVMLKGRLVRKGAVDWGASAEVWEKARAKGKEPTASTATSYAWLIWLRADRRDAGSAWDNDTRLRWIRRAIDRLERPGDYPAPAIEVLPPPADGLFAVELAA
jgi:hypothetical protein